MKQIQITVPAEEGEEIVKSLSDFISPSQISHVKGASTSIILINAAANRTGLILDFLDDLGIGRVKGRITITDIEATIPPTRPRKQDKFLKRISIEELQQNVSDLSKLDFNFTAMIVLSSILAALGLINNDVVTIIASMIIAPLLGPIVGISFSALISEKKILQKAAVSEIVGIVISIVIGVLIGIVYGITQDQATDFMIKRGEPNLIHVIIALASGLVAGICFVSGTSLALVGVAAAATLIPGSVNIGLALGMMEWSIAFGSLILFVVNVSCIHLGCMLIFWIRKVEPPQVVKRVKAKKSRTWQIVAIVIILVVALIPIAQTSLSIVRKWRYQKIAYDVSDSFFASVDGYLHTETLEIDIQGGFFGDYIINIHIRILASKLLPNSTQLDLKTAIETQANHAISSMRLEVILSQQFSNEPLLVDSLTPCRTTTTPDIVRPILCPTKEMEIYC